MGYIVIKDFRYGLDTRKSLASATAGTLRVLNNSHVTRGGEIETRKAFERLTVDPLPVSTFGLADIADTLWTFGSVVEPAGLPGWLNYKRLQHPDGTSAMSATLCVKVFQQKLYVVARFEDGRVCHYFDGELVEDWAAGVVQSYMTNNAGIAEYLKDLIDASADYSASRVGSVITIAGHTGVEFTISATAENVTGGTDDQTAATATPTPAIADITEVLSNAQLVVLTGAASTQSSGTVELTGGAGGSVTSITVNGVEVLGATVNYVTSLSDTATAIAAQITSYPSNPEYTATAVGAVVTIKAAVVEGANPNGYVVTATMSTMTHTDTNMSGGITNGISSITVDGVEILNKAVGYSTTLSALATALAAQINTYTSSPNYDAVANNSTLTIKGVAGSGSTPNGKIVTATTVGTCTISGSGGAMANGVGAVSGQAQQSTVTIGGTFEAGDRFTITLGGETFGADTRPMDVATVVNPHNKKMYGVTEGTDDLFVGALRDARGWSTDDTGADNLHMSEEDELAEIATGLGKYYNLLAVFAKKAVILWSMRADPDENAPFQTVPNTGTVAPRSIVGVGYGDLFYLGNSGIKALRARDSSNAAAVADVSAPIDETVNAAREALTADEQKRLLGLVEPGKDGRVWYPIGQNVYVLSLFPTSKISAWSTYSLGFSIVDYAIAEDRVYVRGDDRHVYLYGGEDGVTYDTSAVTVTTPFLDAETPGTVKTASAIDVQVEGTWQIEVATDPRQPDVYEVVAVVSGVTNAMQTITYNAQSTHFSFRFTRSAASRGRVISAILHYTD